jgi:hypothetical protein
LLLRSVKIIQIFTINIYNVTYDDGLLHRSQRGVEPSLADACEAVSVRVED